jgi:hypothetical protein
LTLQNYDSRGRCKNDFAVPPQVDFLIFIIAMQGCIWEVMPHCDERPSETLPNLPGCEMKITLPVVMNTKKRPTTCAGIDRVAY